MQKAADVSSYVGDYPNFTFDVQQRSPVSIQLCLVLQSAIFFQLR